MKAVFPPWPIREFRDRNDGIPESGREDSIFRGAGAFFGAHKGARFPGPSASVHYCGLGVRSCPLWDRLMLTMFRATPVRPNVSVTLAVMVTVFSLGGSRRAVPTAQSAVTRTRPFASISEPAMLNSGARFTPAGTMLPLACRIGAENVSSWLGKLRFGPAAAPVFGLGICEPSAMSPTLG